MSFTLLSKFEDLDRLPASKQQERDEKLKYVFMENSYLFYAVTLWVTFALIWNDATFLMLFVEIFLSENLNGGVFSDII